MYTVDLSMSRKVLLSGIGADVLSWGKEFDDYELLDGNTVVAHFKDGTVEEGKLIVGADGSRFKVTRHFLLRLCSG